MSTTTTQTPARILDTDSADRALISVDGVDYWTSPGSEGFIREMLAICATGDILGALTTGDITYEPA